MLNLKYIRLRENIEVTCHLQHRQQQHGTFFSYRGKACLAKQELAVLPSALVAASQRSLSTDLQSWILST